MSKGICEPDRASIYVCEMCGKSSSESDFMYLALRPMPEARKHQWPRTQELTLAICGDCVIEMRKHIEEVRHDSRYYKTRCSWLEEDIQELKTPSKKPQLLIDSNERNALDFARNFPDMVRVGWGEKSDARTPE